MPFSSANFFISKFTSHQLTASGKPHLSPQIIARTYIAIKQQTLKAKYDEWQIKSYEKCQKCTNQSKDVRFKEKHWKWNFAITHARRLVSTEQRRLLNWLIRVRMRALRCSCISTKSGPPNLHVCCFFIVSNFLILSSIRDFKGCYI